MINIDEITNELKIEKNKRLRKENEKKTDKKEEKIRAKD